jgi:hypothetical protein
MAEWTARNPDYEKQRYADNREAQKEKSAEWKRKNPERVKAYQQMWYLENADKGRLASLRWARNNPERVTKNKAEWYISNRASLLLYAAEYCVTHAEKIKAARERDCGKKAVQNSIWKKSNPDRVASYTAKRRSAKLSATPAWVEFDAILSLYTEARSRSESEGVVYHVDHIVPLQSEFVCGLHCLSNLQIIPGKENISKGNRTWPGQEWVLTP